LLAVLYVLFAGAGLLVSRREPETASIHNRALLVLWWLFPVAVTFCVSLQLAIFVPRYLLICAPPMLILAAIGVCAAKSGPTRWVALGTVLAASAYGTCLYQRSNIDAQHSNDWRGAAIYMARSLQDGDMVLFYYGAERLPFDFYIMQNSPHAHFTVYPEGSKVDLLSGNAQEIDNKFLEQLSDHRQRIFLLSEFQPNERSGRVMASLGSHCSRSTTQYFGFVHVDQLDCNVSNSR